MLYMCVWVSVCVCIQLGVLEFGAASSCAVQPAASRGDYSKLLVVLLIIGSVCLLIISFGLGYICWQRRLLASKTMVGTHTHIQHIQTLTSFTQSVIYLYI